MNPLARAAALALAAAALAQTPSLKTFAEGYLFPADLGPAAIDVTSYPPAMRRDYLIFAARCSSCHSLARAVNAPQSTRAEWAPYVEKMHWYARNSPVEAFPGQERRRVLDFLAYDSRVRKVERRAEFEARLRRLRAAFVEECLARGLPRKRCESAP